MIIAIIGWLGTLLYLINHAYISLNKHWKKKVYYMGNAIAAACLVFSSFINESWQAVVINGFWAIISIVLLWGFSVNKLKFSLSLFYLVIGSLLAFFVIRIFVIDTIDVSILGWTSAFIFSAAYLLFCQEKLLQRYYLCWNAFAAIAILPQLWLDQNWPVFGLEVVWAGISIYGAMHRFKQVRLL